ncbi:type II toxin-antitoxin system VapC family toxin [Natronosporangium hydrolyticum]|uniref:Ribonuclease VapC n=1 Tax=Natronosporangium hydrolyticum TaxID=2811111 RepID=A0A895YDH8_9ACTN|nr:type II toxin-antitoxin system VapC family toxin [Natronosporangium hydrolyticum]QSB13439.1 type II toxin-antitoxin system VapC family toxin [Natronosporangium hydrolyticum]
MIVLDTSALVEFLVGADQLAEVVRSVAAGEVLAAPHAADLEIASALRGLVHENKLPANEAQRALELFAAMGVRRYEHLSLFPRIWELRHNMWPYDAAYVALAESLKVTLVTVDVKFVGAPGMRCPLRNLREA